MVNDAAVAELDRSFHALAHPVRRAILARLARGPATVAQAGGGTGASKPALTRHLQVLETAGLVSRSVRGRTHVLALRPQHLAAAASWIDAQRALWERKFAIMAEHLADEET